MTKCQFLSEILVNQFLQDWLIIQLLCDYYLVFNKKRLYGGISYEKVVSDAITEMMHLCVANHGWYLLNTMPIIKTRKLPRQVDFFVFCNRALSVNMCDANWSWSLQNYKYLRMKPAQARFWFIQHNGITLSMSTRSDILFLYMCAQSLLLFKFIKSCKQYSW